MARPSTITLTFSASSAWTFKTLKAKLKMPNADAGHQQDTSKCLSGCASKLAKMFVSRFGQTDIHQSLPQWLISMQFMGTIE